MSLTFGREAKNYNWGFTEASLPRFFKGNEDGVLVCHGFGCTPSTVRCLYDRAVGMGLTAVMPLLTGHGKTLGELEAASCEDWLRDVGEAYAKLCEAGCKRVFLCGLSLGALLMADLAGKHTDDPRLAGVFLMCPPIRMKAYLNVCADSAPLIPYVKTGDSFAQEGMEQYMGMATRKLNDIRKAARLARKAAGSISIPVMLVEAGRDSRVNPVSYRILMDKLPRASHIVIKDAPHGIPYSDKKDKLCDIFEGFLTPLIKKNR